MLAKLTEKERIMTEVLANPIAATEILFSNALTLSEFNEQNSEVRKSQYPFLSFGGLFLHNKNKSEQENFNIKKGFIEKIALGGRLTGKTFCLVKTDAPLEVLWKTFSWAVISSLDKLHLVGVVETLISIFENHPFFSLFKPHIVRSPNYILEFPNGCKIESVNNNTKGKSPGEQWYSRHVDLNFEEEASFLDHNITHKKMMARSELGVIKRYNGMCTFSHSSPMGKLFYDPEYKNKIINLPSYSSPHYSRENEKEAIEEFDGRNSISYQVQIQGKVTDDMDSAFLMDRVEKCINENNPIKNFEINKDNFNMHPEILFLERPNNASKAGVYLDIGEGSAPTEIIVIFKVGETYRYVYNITATKITPDEQYELVRFIISAVQANVIGLDTTSGVGKAMFSNLSKDYAQNLVAVCFNEKLVVDFEKDEKGFAKPDEHGNIQYKEERVDNWAFQRLKHILYNGLIEINKDYKFEKQISNVCIKKVGLSTQFIYKTANHLWQAFQVFAITEWQTEFADLNPIQQPKMSMGVFN